jgi:hypothetical protein
VLLVFPEPLFAYSKRIGKFEIHSDQPIPDNIQQVIDLATKRLERSTLYSTDRSFDLFIANQSWRRYLLSPVNANAFGISHAWTGNTILNKCDIERDLCFNDMPQWNQRPLHEVIAHECSHHLLSDRLGVLDYLRLETWKNEGYCEYVSGGGSYDPQKGESNLRSGSKDPSPAFQYFTYRVAVDFLLEESDLDTNVFLRSDIDFADTLKRAVQARTKPSTAK